MTTEKSQLEKLANKIQDIALELLEKKCPRCGAPSKNKSNPQGRCASCLAKLRRAKKTPGHWQRAQTKADDSLRRQKGKNGTAPGTSKGNGTRKEIVDKIMRAERKTGQKLSPDRKDNSRGYEPSNTRAVPEHLNRGRHNVDPKKLAAWRKRLKKTLDELGLSVDEFQTLAKSRYQEISGEPDMLFWNILNLFTEEEQLKKDYDASPPAEFRQISRQMQAVNQAYIPAPLTYIAMLESSGGKNREHEEVKVGIHKGTQAVSSYGLMPKYLQEVVKKYKPLANTETGKKIASVDRPQDVANITRDPKHDDEAMKHVWDYNQKRLSKYVSDPEHLELLGIAAHRRGVTGALSLYGDGDIERVKSDPYVSKYLKIKQKT